MTSSLLGGVGTDAAFVAAAVAARGARGIAPAADANLAA
jgi:hypothetical protein